MFRIPRAGFYEAEGTRAFKVRQADWYWEENASGDQYWYILVTNGDETRMVLERDLAWSKLNIFS